MRYASCVQYDVYSKLSLLEIDPTLYSYSDNVNNIVFAKYFDRDNIVVSY